MGSIDIFDGAFKIYILMTIIPLWLLISTAVDCLWLGKMASEFRLLALMFLSDPGTSIHVSGEVRGKHSPKTGRAQNALPICYLSCSPEEAPQELHHGQAGRPDDHKLGNECGGTELGWYPNIEQWWAVGRDVLEVHLLSQMLTPLVLRWGEGEGSGI